jgi:hypothetical protein
MYSIQCSANNLFDLTGTTPSAERAPYLATRGSRLFNRLSPSIDRMPLVALRREQDDGKMYSLRQFPCTAVSPYM